MSDAQAVSKSKLFHNRNFLLLFAGQTLSGFGDWFRTILTIGLIYAWTGSAANLSLMFISSILPTVLVSTFVGPLIDRYSKRNIMIFADLCRVFIGCGFAILVTFQSIVWLYVLLAVNGAFNGFYLPARSALIPEIVEKEKLTQANSFLATTFSTVMLVATGVGGLVADVLSPQMIYLIDASTFLLSALTLVFLRPSQQMQHRPSRESYTRQIREGVQEIRKSPKIQSAIWILMARETALSVVYVIFSIYILKIVQQGNFGLGLGHLFSGLGQIIGGLTLAAYFKRKSFSEKRYKIGSTVCLTLLGLFHSLSYQQDQFWVFLLLVAIANLWYSPIDILSSTSIMTYSQAETRGRIFAVSLALSRLLYLGGFLLVAVIGDIVPISVIALGLAAFLLIAAILNVWVASRQEEHGANPPAMEQNVQT